VLQDNLVALKLFLPHVTITHSPQIYLHTAHHVRNAGAGGAFPLIFTGTLILL